MRVAHWFATYRGGQMVDRRRFMRLAAAGVALSGIALLDACTPTAPAPAPTSAPGAPKPTSAPTSAPAPAPTTAPATVAPKPASTGGRSVQLPSRFPVQGIKPDLPPSPDGLIDAGFVNYPASPVKSVAD